MPTAPIQERFAPDAPFRFVGGDPSLDFVNTADWTPRGLARDRFTGYDRLVEWARGAGLLGASEARRMAQTAAKHPRRAAATLEAACQTRDVLQTVFASLVDGRISANGLERLNAMVTDAATHIRLIQDAGGQVSRSWARLGESPGSLLWPVAWSALDLLSSTDAERLRMCAGQDCGWMYVDRSRNGLRRWCEMSVCGTAEKNRRRASLG
jgi:predicted RNA-binding Zn ribbon-like protein